MISAGNEERVLLPDRGRVTEESEIFRVPATVRRMFENSFADPGVAAEMEEVEFVVVAGLHVVVVVRVAAEYDHVIAQDFCRMVSPL